MRILFTRFPLESSLVGGAENQVMTLITGLRSKGHTVGFLGSCPALLQRCREEKIACYKHSSVPVPVTKKGCLQFFFQKSRITREINAHIRASGSYDAVCMLSLPEKICSTDFALSLGLKVFWIEHDSIGHWLTWNPWKRCLQRLSRAVTTICVSGLSRKLYASLGFANEGLKVIANGIEEHRYNSLLQLPFNVFEKKSPMHIGCIARLSKEKGVDVLIDALATCTNVRCSILGNGRELHTLQQQVLQGKERGKNLNITFIDHTKDIIEFYRSIDILILPSIHHDPFGLVAAEAMLAGRPVIVTNMCGIAEYLHSGEDGLIVDSKSVSALVLGVERLQDPKIHSALAIAGRVTAKELFSSNAMVNAYEKLLLQT